MSQKRLVPSSKLQSFNTENTKATEEHGVKVLCALGVLSVLRVKAWRWRFRAWDLEVIWNLEIGTSSFRTGPAPQGGPPLPS